MNDAEKFFMQNLEQNDTEIGTIVLLHGYGADAEDMEFLKTEWKKFAPNWKITALNGPIELNPGYAWFDLTSKTWVEEMIETAKNLEEKFANYKKKLIFAGFSQGAFLAAYLALFSDLNVCGCISFSGGILPIANKEPKKTPILLVHGTEDGIILPDWYYDSLEYGKEYDLPVNGSLIAQMEHEINSEAFEHASFYLKSLINPSC